MSEAIDAPAGWAGKAVALHTRQTREADHFLLRLKCDEKAVKQFGAPAGIWMEYILPREAPVVRIELQWFDKPACRVAEASWLTFRPPVRGGGGWKLEKMGEWIDPSEVVLNGSRRLHAVQGGAVYQDSQGALKLETLDAPLVALGDPVLLDFNNRLPPARKGLHCNLHNNMWGTNFPMWYEDDARFRFKLTFE